MEQETANGFGIEMTEIMQMFRPSFGIGMKSINDYLIIESINPITLKLVDNTLHPSILAEVEKRYKVLKD